MIIYSCFSNGITMPAVKRLIGFLILPVFLVTAWDIAVITDDDIQLLQQDKFISVASGHFKDLASGSYDPVRGELYISDSNQRNASLFRISTFSSNVETGFYPVISKQQTVVTGVAFDPVTSTLFWSTGSGRTIRKLIVSHTVKSQNIQAGDVLHEFKDEIPLGIGVDSCRQFVYWTNGNLLKPSIERSRTDGTDREVIIDTKLFQPLGIAVDQQAKKIYWTDDLEGIYYSIERSDLDGENRQTVIYGTHHQPDAISLAGDKVYWVDPVERDLWSLPKNSNSAMEPEIVQNFETKRPIGVISNTLYLDINPDECPLLAPYRERIERNYKNSISSIIPGTVHDLTKYSEHDISFQMEYCLNNGTFVNNGCKCRKGYTGSRCETSICHNYCVRGTCKVEDGNATCMCPSGFSGSRCEIDKCHGMCLNGGTCSLDDEKGTSCNCKQGYSGDRCQFLTDVIGQLCNTYCEYGDLSALRLQSTTAAYGERVNDDDGVPHSLMRICSCSGEKMSSVSDRYDRLAEDTHNQNQHLVSELSGRFNVLVTTSLGILCIILALTVIFLTTKVYVLKKRPRIRKRIVVNKPLAPITCRPQSTPDQCEITIENCCNMNICETPCFEPDFRSTKATFKKSKSEDKKMLIGSMHSNSSQDEDY